MVHLDYVTMMMMMVTKMHDKCFNTLLVFSCVINATKNYYDSDIVFFLHTSCKSASVHCFIIL